MMALKKASYGRLIYLAAAMIRGLNVMYELILPNVCYCSRAIALSLGVASLLAARPHHLTMLNPNMSALPSENVKLSLPDGLTAGQQAHIRNRQCDPVEG
jgi:hypothetical protein